MANTVFENKIIEAKAKDLLTTAVNTRSLMALDNSLTQEAGMEKVVNVYTYTGTAEEVQPGQGNTHRGSIAYETKSYKVKLVQEVFDYFDEDFMKDNTVVDNMTNGAVQTMANKMTADFVAEVKKASLTQNLPTSKKINYDTVVDAIAKLNLEKEEGLFLLLPNAWKADIRKDPDFKAANYGEIVFDGQIGTVCGLPVVATKALTDTAAVMSKNAITLFLKKDMEIEQDRDKEKRTNTVILRNAYLVALTHADKICKIVAGA